MGETGSASRVRAVILETLRDPKTGPLLRAIYNFDPNLYKHSTRAAVYALDLASNFPLFDGVDEKQLVLGVLFHDVGKLLWPRSVYDNPGPIVGREREYITLHPLQGALWLMGATDLSDTAVSIVVEHHERADGSGYPFGKMESDIQPPSLLCGLVEVYDALISDRPYRPAYTRDQAVSMIMSKQTGFPRKWLDHFIQWSSDQPEIQFADRYQSGEGESLALPLPIDVNTDGRRRSDCDSQRSLPASPGALLANNAFSRRR